MTKPSPERIRAAMEDLYVLDPSLREQGPELERVISALLESRPDVHVDARFVESLRRSLSERSRKRSTSFLSTFLSMNAKYLIPIGVVALVMVVAVIVREPNFLAKPESVSQRSDETSSFSHAVVTRVAPNAFGALSNGSVSAADSGEVVTAAPMPSFATQSSGSVAVRTAAPMMLTAPSKAVPAPMPIEPHYYERSRYVYDGELPKLESQVSVYERNKNALDASALSGVIQGLKFGPIDLKSFGNMNVQQLTLSQSGDSGYQMNIDINEGMINLNEKYSGGIKPLLMPCRQGSCGGSVQPLSPKDIPTDDVLIGIANGFLSDHGISKEVYGDPVVDHQWNRVLPMMKGSEVRTYPVYAPEAITITYPLRIDGMTVYDQSGNPFGLSVSVNVREKRVSSVWNLSAQQYVASTYDAITDPKQILDYAARGDAYAPPFGQDPNERTTDVKLDAPTVVLMDTYHTREDGTNGELFVPVLRFPLSKDAAQNEYRTSVMVPLVKDLLNEPVIMYGRAASASGSGVASPGGVVNAEASVDPTPAPAPMLVK